MAKIDENLMNFNGELQSIKKKQNVHSKTIKYNMRN